MGKLIFLLVILAGIFSQLQEANSRKCKRLFNKWACDDTVPSKFYPWKNRDATRRIYPRNAKGPTKPMDITFVPFHAKVPGCVRKPFHWECPPGIVPEVHEMPHWATSFDDPSLIELGCVRTMFFWKCPPGTLNRPNPGKSVGPTVPNVNAEKLNARVGFFRPPPRNPIICCVCPDDPTSICCGDPLCRGSLTGK